MVTHRNLWTWYCSNYLMIFWYHYLEQLWDCVEDMRACKFFVMICSNWKSLRRENFQQRSLAEVQVCVSSFCLAADHFRLECGMFVGEFDRPNLLKPVWNHSAFQEFWIACPAWDSQPTRSSKRRGQVLRNWTLNELEDKGDMVTFQWGKAGPNASCRTSSVWRNLGVEWSEWSEWSIVSTVRCLAKRLSAQQGDVALVLWTHGNWGAEWSVESDSQDEVSSWRNIQSYSVIFSPDAKRFFIILNVLACFGHRNGDPVSGSCFRPRRGREVQNARRPGWSTFQGWLDLHMTLILKTVPSWTNLQGYLQRCRISSLCLVVACWCYSQLNWCTCCWHCWQESRFVKSDSAKALHFSIFRFSWMLNKPCNKLKHLTISTALDWNCWHMFS